MTLAAAEALSPNKEISMSYKKGQEILIMKMVPLHPGDRSPPSLLSEDKPPEGEYSKESEKVKDGEKRTRTRGNSISLVVSNGSLGIHNTYEWWIPMVTQAESDDSEIYSVQVSNSLLYHLV